MKRKRTILAAVMICTILTAFIFSFRSLAYEASDNYEDTAAKVGTEYETEENFLDTAWNSIEKNKDSILSTLSLAGSIILMLGYKNGLIPLIREGLSAIGSATKKMSEKTSELSEMSAGVLEKTELRIAKIETALTEMSEKLSWAADTAKLEERILKEGNITRDLMEGEIDMLYDIFMAAALPEYLKERIGERVSEMKKRINISEDGNDRSHEE